VGFLVSRYPIENMEEGMNKMSGIIIGLNSAFAHKKEFDKSGRSIAPPPSGDELKSYG